MRTIAVALLSTIFSAACCPAAEPAAKTDAVAALTVFSWDRVPLNTHEIRNRT
jgi:hypothetical protein